MNELEVEQIAKLAKRLGMDGVVELCQDWARLKVENEKLLTLLEKAMTLAPPAPVHVTVSAERLEELKTEIQEKKD